MIVLSSYYRDSSLYASLNTSMFQLCLAMYVCTLYVCVNILCSYDKSVYSLWNCRVDEVARTNLEKCLLTRDPVVMHLTINFDPEV